MLNYFKMKTKQNLRLIIFGLVLTILIMGPFLVKVNRYGFSGLGSVGDALKGTYAAFVSAAHRFNFYGVDITTFDGATERYLRPNYPNAYLPFVIFSFIGRYIGFELSYVLLYMVHIFLFAYTALLLSIKHFGMKTIWAEVFTASASVALIYGTWYIPYLFASSLIAPILYFNIDAVDSGKKLKLFVASLWYVLGFTSGYLPVSFFLCLYAYVFTILYFKLWRSEKIKFHKFIDFCIPPVIAGMVTLIYYLQCYWYESKIVGTDGGNDISQIFSYWLPFKDLFKFFSRSITSNQVFENYDMLSIGLLWTVLLLLCVLFLDRGRIEKNKRMFMSIGILTNIFFILCCDSKDIPIATWFYSFVPGLGTMHLPSRYLFITYMLMLLSFCYYMQILTDSDALRFHKKECIIIMGLIMVATVSVLVSGTSFVDQQQLLIEVTLTVAVLLIVIKKGNFSIALCYFLSISQLLIPLNTQLQYYNFTENDESLKQKSLIYDQSSIYYLDNYIDTTFSEKSVYKYVAYDEKGGGSRLSARKYVLV